MNTLYTGIAVGFWALVGLASTLVAGAFVAHAPVRMELEYLRFEDGHFYQHIAVSGADAVNGDWTARIWREDEGGFTPLCEGGGRFPYTGKPSRPMTPSYWTDDDCPEVLPGDHAMASWQYTDEHGVQRRFSAQIVIP